MGDIGKIFHHLASRGTLSSEPAAPTACCHCWGGDPFFCFAPPQTTNSTTSVLLLRLRGRSCCGDRSGSFRHARNERQHPHTSRAGVGAPAVPHPVATPGWFRCRLCWWEAKPRLSVLCAKSPLPRLSPFRELPKPTGTLVFTPVGVFQLTLSGVRWCGW